MFCELLSHLHVMVLDVQYNALPARVSFNVGYSIISEGVAQVQHSEGLGSPCSDPCVRVGSHKRRGALLCGSGGPWCFFGWRRKGNSQGAPTSSTLVAELPRLEVETGKAVLPLEAGDPGCQVKEMIQWGLVQPCLLAQAAQAIQLCRICPGT